MKYLILIWALFGLSACATPDLVHHMVGQQTKPQYIESYEEENSIIETKTQHAAQPKEQEKKCDGVCGYITTEEFSKQKEFMKECGGLYSKNDCSNKFVEMIYAKFSIRYPYAKYSDVLTWCKANPLKCSFLNVKKANLVEEQIIASNNNEIHAANIEKRSNDIARENEVKSARWKSFLKGFSDGMNQPGNSGQKTNINCTSYQYGNMVNTNCH